MFCLSLHPPLQLDEVGLTWDEEEMDKDVQNLPSKLQEWGTNSMVWGAPLEEEMCASEGDVLGSIAPNPMRDDLAIAIEAAEKEAAAKEEKNAVQELVDEVVEVGMMSPDKFPFFFVIVHTPSPPKNTHFLS